jgi:hypothetical protein
MYGRSWQQVTETLFFTALNFPCHHHCPQSRASLSMEISSVEVEGQVNICMINTYYILF